MLTHSSPCLVIPKRLAESRRPRSKESTTISSWSSTTAAAAAAVVVSDSDLALETPALSATAPDLPS